MRLTPLNTERLQSFKRLACDKHDSVGQRYGSKPYSYHLHMVVSVAKRFSHLLKSREEAFIVYMACWGHDLIEDTRSTYNDVQDMVYNALGSMDVKEKKMIAVNVTEAIYLCTDHKGRNRKERKPLKYYRELNMNKYAEYVKLCDIIANTMYSFISGNPMYDVYAGELLDLRTKINSGSRFEEIYDFLENLVVVPNLTEK